MPPTVGAGGFARSPVSTLSGIELLGSLVWHRSKAKIKKIFKHDYPETPFSRPYQRELPQELLDMILAHVLLDTPTLKACSATCRSWYITTLPHLHHTLTLHRRGPNPASQGIIPLQKLGKMQLLPLVKRLRILDYHGPTILSARSLVYFSALTSVQELLIDELDLRALIPQMQQYFGHFAQTLRSLVLRKPSGTHDQLLYLLGLFPNLDDFGLIHNDTEESTPGQVLVPRSAPSLRGQLTLAWFSGEVFLRDMSELSGGLRFRSMDLHEADGVRFLLDTCAKTLETLRIYPAHWIRSSETFLRGFDLSNNRSLRSLEIPVNSISQHPATAPSFLRELMATITSPVFSDVVIVLEDGAIDNPWFSRYRLFHAVRSVHEVKPFRLVFCLEVWEGSLEYTVGRLKRYINAEAAEGGLDFLPRPPVIVSNTQATYVPRE